MTDDRIDEQPDGQAEAASAEAAGADDDALVSRLRVIEDQPLSTRATAYAQVHDGLRSRLEAGDAPRRDA